MPAQKRRLKQAVNKVLKIQLSTLIQHGSEKSQHSKIECSLIFPDLITTQKSSREFWLQCIVPACSGIFVFSKLRLLILAYWKVAERRRQLSPSKKLNHLSRKKKLKSKEFLDLYSAIWQGTAPVKYKCPDHALRQRLEMIAKQMGGPPF
jgi:hypothetical protein